MPQKSHHHYWSDDAVRRADEIHYSLYHADLEWIEVTDPAKPIPMTDQQRVDRQKAAVLLYVDLFAADETTALRIEVLGRARQLTPKQLTRQSGIDIQRLVNTVGHLNTIHVERLAFWLKVPSEAIIAPPGPHVEERREQRLQLRLGDAAPLGSELRRSLHRSVFRPELPLPIRASLIRCMRGLTLDELAYAASVSRAEAASVEDSRPLPVGILKTIDRISTAMQVSPEIYRDSPEIRLHLALREVRTTRNNKLDAAYDLLDPLLPAEMSLGESLTGSSTWRTRLAQSPQILRSWRPT